MSGYISYVLYRVNKSNDLFAFFVLHSSIKSRTDHVFVYMLLIKKLYNLYALPLCTSFIGNRILIKTLCLLITKY